MSRQVNLYEAKTNLSQLVEDAAKGEEIIIAKNGKPMAKLVVVESANADQPKKRVGGQWAKYLTPEELTDLGTEEWWRRWKEADAEIERDFEESLNQNFDDLGREFKWADTSSTPTPSSASKPNRKRSARKRVKR
jgi:prevent-host-death family protein